MKFSPSRQAGGAGPVGRTTQTKNAKTKNNTKRKAQKQREIKISGSQKKRKSANQEAKGVKN
jgi:hypothetical protein